MAILPFIPRQDFTGGSVLATQVIHAADVNNLETLITDVAVQVDGYGAVGDGVTNDTVAIQNAINAAASLTTGSAKVVLGSKTYKLLNQTSKSYALSIPSRVFLVGAEKGVSVLSYQDTGTCIVLANSLTLIPTATTGAVLRNFTIQGTSSGSIGINLTGAQDCIIDAISVTSFTTGTGIYLTGYHDTSPGNTNSIFNEKNHFLHVTVSNCKYGLDAVGGDTSAIDSNVRFNQFISCNFLGTGVPSDGANATTIGVRLQERVSDNNFSGCVIQHASSRLVEIRDEGNIFTNCNVLGSAGDGYLLTAASSGTLIVGGLISTIIGTAFNDSGTRNEQWGWDNGAAVRTYLLKNNVSLPVLDEGGQVYNIKSAMFGAKGDLRSATDGAITAGTRIVSSPTLALTQADVGKLLFVAGAGGVNRTASVSTTLGSNTVTATGGAGTFLVGDQYTAIVIPGAGSGGKDLVSPIFSVAGDGSSVTIRDLAGASVTNVTAGVRTTIGYGGTVASVSGNTATFTNATPLATTTLTATEVYIGTDDTAAIQSAIDTVSNTKGGGIVFAPPGKYLLASRTIISSAGGASGVGASVPTAIYLKPKVSFIGAGSAYTSFYLASNDASFFRANSVLSGNNATINSTVTIGDKTYGVDSSNGFSIKDNVFLGIGQNPTDNPEVIQGSIAKVTAVTDGTHISLDVASSLTWNSAGQGGANAQPAFAGGNVGVRTIQKLTGVIEGVSYGGFSMINPYTTLGANCRQGIALNITRNINIFDVYGEHVGSGIISGGYNFGNTYRNIRVGMCDAQNGQASLGRAFGHWNSNGCVFDGVFVESLDNALCLFESYCRGISVKDTFIRWNRASSIGQISILGMSEDSSVSFTDLSIDLSTTGSLVSVLNTYDMSIMNLSVRGSVVPSNIPLWMVNGFLNIQKSDGTFRHYEMSRLEQHTLDVRLIDNMSNAIYYGPPGFLAYFDTYVPSTVSSSQLTNLFIGITGNISTPLSVNVDWNPGIWARSLGRLGSGYQADTNEDKAVAIRITTAAAGGLSGNDHLIMRFWTLKDVWSSSIGSQAVPGVSTFSTDLTYSGSEPGSELWERFRPIQYQNVPKDYYGTAAPVSGTYNLADRFWNTNPVANVGNVGWINIAAGSPGTWQRFGLISTIGSDFQLITDAPTSPGRTLQEWRVNHTPVAVMNSGGGLSLGYSSDQMAAAAGLSVLGLTGIGIAAQSTQQLTVKSQADANYSLVLDTHSGTPSANIMEVRLNGTAQWFTGTAGGIKIGGAAQPSGAVHISQAYAGTTWTAGFISNTQFTNAGLTTARATYSDIDIANSSGTFSQAVGEESSITYLGTVGAGSTGITSAFNLKATKQVGTTATGHIGAWYGFFLPAVTGAGAGANVTIDNNYGILVRDQSIALTGLTITASYGSYIDVQTVIGANNYAYYAAGGQSYFKSADATQVPMTIDTVSTPTANIANFKANGSTVASIGSSGLITGLSGLTISGGTVSLNVSSNFNTNINTGTSTGTVTIGNSGSTASVNISANLASTWQVASANLTIQTATSGTLAVTSAGALNLTSGAASTLALTGGLTISNALAVTLANSTAALNFDQASNTLVIDATNHRVGIGVAGPAALFSVGTASALQITSAGTLSTSGNISTTGSGTITSAGLLTGSSGLTVIGATVSLNASSNFNTNINTGTSTGIVTIGNSASTAAVNINANLASTWQVTSANLTIQTITSGTLTLNSAAASTWTITGGLTWSNAVTISSASSSAFAVGANGTTTPAFQIDASTASSVTGISLKSNSAGNKVALLATSSAGQANEGITIDAKGTGTISLNNVSGTGAIVFGTNMLVPNTSNMTTLAGPIPLAWTIPASATSSERIGFEVFQGGYSRSISAGYATQRFCLIDQPTVSGAFTVTTAATFAIAAAPGVASSAVITNAYAFWVQAGLAELDGGLTTTGAAVSLNAASNFSVGIANTSNTSTVTIGNSSLSTLTLTTGAGIAITSATASTWAATGGLTFSAGPFKVTSQRVLRAMGASVGSANNLSLGTDGNLFHITGATQINLIDSTNWQAGAEVTLIFDSNPVVKNNQAASGSNKPLLLQGGADFTTAANNTLSLIYDGTSWYERGRKT